MPIETLRVLQVESSSLACRGDAARSGFYGGRGAAMRSALALLLLAASLVLHAVARADVEFVQPVPDLVGAQHTGRQLLQSAGAGSYGGYGYGYGEYGYGSYGRRRLIMTESGGYGYGEYGYGEYGYGSNARRLSEELLQLEPSDPLLEYAEQQAAAQQAAEEQQQQGLSAAAASAIQHAHGKRSAWNVPAGQCYCRYDTDFNTWAVAEETCKQALYKRCKSESGLPCEWLDKFYAPMKGPAHSLPHEQDIFAFLHEDCTPQPPCACAGLKLDGSDAVPASVACCRDLRVACRTPFSGLCCKKVADFCSDDKSNPMIAAWASHALHRADCSAYQGVPYQFTPLEQMTAATSAPKQQQKQQQLVDSKPSEAELLHQALNIQQQQAAAAAAAPAGSSFGATFLAAVAAGAVCVAVVAVLFSLRREEQHDLDDEDDEDDNMSYNNNSNNTQRSLNFTTLDACPPGGLCCEGSAASQSAADLAGLPHVVSVSTLSSSGSVREPLLPQNTQGMNRCMSNVSGMASNVSGGDLSMLRSCSQTSLDTMQ
ncbi:hypothetical protein OEZ86_008924 [Tetradesmus obliquus]|nr:hypothetical protein OEZ86_008924 [Tetradesmus obliquus]